MGWISNIFSKSTASVIDSTGNALDKLLTSKDERLQAKALFEHGIKRLVNESSAEINSHVEKMEEERTERHETDMKSDSWLSKNIRPLTLAFMTVSVVALAFISVFYSGFTAQQAETVKEWIGFFTTVMVTIYGFYFSARGIEKVSKTIKSK